MSEPSTLPPPAEPTAPTAEAATSTLSVPAPVESQAPVVDAQHPWLGLLPFKEIHSDYFFGRDDEIADIVSRIRENDLTILFGQSGLGKTSLLGAGVVPRLRRLGYTPLLLRLDHSSKAPSLLAQTHAALRSVLPPGAVWPDDADTTSLWEIFHRGDGLLPEDSPIPVLIFDQFEEIFTLGRQRTERRPGADQWLEEIADLLQNRPPRALEERFAGNRALARDFLFDAVPFRAVFSLREEYLSHLEGWKNRLPLLMQNRMDLHLLDGPQALEAVLGPASLGDPPLVRRSVAIEIVRTVADAPPGTPLPQIKAVPPFLSLVCEQLNATRLAANAAEISAEAVTAQSKNILQRFYEESFTTFPEKEREIIRALIEDPPMVTGSGHRNFLVRKDAETQLEQKGVANAAEVFTTLIQRRLITSDEKDHIERLEITHDVLLKQLLVSRKARHDRLAREAAEAAQSAAEAKASQARKLSIVFGLLAVLALAASVLAFVYYRKAQLVNKENLQNLHEASIADYSLAVRRIDNEGKWHEGVAYLACALEWEPDNRLAALRLYSTLVLNAAEEQNWPRHIIRNPEGNSFQSARLNATGTRLVTVANSEKAARLWDPVTAQPIGQPLQHAGYLYSATFSPDGSKIVTASMDGTARIWDAANGRPIGKPLTQGAAILSASFSPDGKSIVTTGEGGKFILWDAANGTPLLQPIQHGTSAFRALFSPDGSLLLTYDEEVARLWNATTGESVGKPITTSRMIKFAHFSPDGTKVAIVGVNDIDLWEISTSTRIEPPLLSNAWIQAAEFSPDGNQIVTASGKDTARIWSVATGKPMSEPLHHDGPVWHAHFSPDGTRIVTVSGQTAQVWDSINGLPLGGALHHDTRVEEAEFNANCTSIVTVSGPVVQIWDAPTAKPLGEPLRHAKAVNSASFSPDGARVVTASDDHTASLWDAASGAPLGIALRHQGDVRTARFNATGTRIVTASADKTARIWDAATGKPIGAPLRHSAAVATAEFSPDGTQILTTTATPGSTASLWNALTQTALYAPIGEASPFPIRTAQFRQDGKQILALDHGMAASLNPATGKVLSRYPLSEGIAYTGAFSPDGTRVAVVGMSNTGHLLDAASGQSIRHTTEPVSKLSFNSDASLIVAAAMDQYAAGSTSQSAWVWDMTTGKRYGEPLRHGGKVLDARFNTDGARIVTACEDGTARLWDTCGLIKSLTPVPAWVIARAYAVAGETFNDDGELVPIQAEERIKTLNQPAGDKGPWADLVPWLIQAADQRAISLHSALRRRQIAERERDYNTKDSLTSALQYDPSVPLARLMLAGTLLLDDAGRPVATPDPFLLQRVAFLRRFELNHLPDDAELWARAGILLSEQKQPKEALRAVEKALTLDPTLPAASRALARALAADGQNEKALELFEKLMLGPLLSMNDFTIAGDLAVQLGQMPRMREIFRHAEAKFPDSAELQREQGWMLLNRDRPAEALEIFRRYDPLLPPGESPATGAVIGLAVSRWLTGDKEAALADYYRLTTLSPYYLQASFVEKINRAAPIRATLQQILSEMLKRHPELRAPSESPAAAQ